ncbi:MAG: aspartate kinase [Gemmatimonadaceae bacterium]
MIVQKFGGTSVGSAKAMALVMEIVRSKLERRPVVVVSALGGATNALLGMAEQAARGQLIGAMSAVESLRNRHLTEAEALIGPGEECDEVCGEISASFDELANLVVALNTLAHVTPRSLDAIAAMGEQLSSMMIVAGMRKKGIDAAHVDARQVMITDDAFTSAVPQMDAIAERSNAVVLPLVRDGRVPVLGGFIGSCNGVTTTLGRGGSDYSAALVGAALGAESIEIWTDVDGMLTADPRVVEGSRLIERIRFDEASELASFGAKVLHPMTIAPAVRKGIPVWIYNTFRPAQSGTLIAFDAPKRSVSAIAGKTGITVVRVGAPRMLEARGFLRSIFDVFTRHDTSIDVVATSEVSVSVTVDETAHLDEVVVDLRQLGDVAVERNRGIVAVVGAGLGDDSVAMSRAIGALGGLKLHMLSLSATGINLTAIVDGEQVQEAMRRLHREFFPKGGP